VLRHGLPSPHYALETVLNRPTGLPEADPRVQMEAMVTVPAIVRQFIVEQFWVSDPAELTNETSLIEEGVVDSVAMLGMIVFLESEFGIDVEDEETIPENLESISRIAAFVARKQQRAAV
jgi:acyl carrier protein